MRKKLKTSDTDRKCVFLGCKQILSIYNHEIYCHVHCDQVAQERMRKIPYHHPVLTK